MSPVACPGACPGIRQSAGAAGWAFPKVVKPWASEGATRPRTKNARRRSSGVSRARQICPPGRTGDGCLRRMRGNGVPSTRQAAPGKESLVPGGERTAGDEAQIVCLWRKITRCLSIQNPHKTISHCKCPSHAMASTLGGGAPKRLAA